MWEYICKFTIIPASKEYKPISIVVKLEEVMAKMLMATPVKGIDIEVSRGGKMVLDRTPDPLDFMPGGKN